MRAHTLAAVPVLLAATAFAGPVPFDYVGKGKVEVVKLHVDGKSTNVYSGSFRHLLNGQRVTTYCIDPNQAALTGPGTFDLVTLPEAFSGRSDPAGIADAIARVAQAAGPDLFSDDVDKVTASAFQMAAWEIVVDFDAEAGRDALNFASGDLMITRSNGRSLRGRSASLAESLLDAAFVGDARTGRFVALHHPESQDFITIPAPGALAMLALAYPVVARRRRG
jgi:hypothetical protein